MPHPMKALPALVLGLSLCVAAAAAGAQEFTALARVDPARSSIVDGRQGAEVVLTLSQPVPWRVHTLDDPPRLVVDFREADFSGLPEAGLGESAWIGGQRHGRFRPGWSRLVMDLAAPLAVERAGMATGADDGSARIAIALRRTDAATFAARAGAPASPAFPVADIAPAPAPREGRLLVALDPGHGGLDPGAIREGVEEADLMLTFARDLREVLRRTGRFDVILTRDGDDFVSLEARLAIAKRAGADVFLSLHADAIAEGVARGAQVYTFAEDASSVASAQLAERHGRADLLAGVDLTGQDDGVARVLMALARTETAPRSDNLAAALVDGLGDAGVRIHRRAREEAQFAVLKAPDIPSALIEVGFMSSPGELEKLQSAAWRAQAAEGIAAGLTAWADAEAARAALLRR